MKYDVRVAALYVTVEADSPLDAKRKARATFDLSTVHCSDCCIILPSVVTPSPAFSIRPEMEAAEREKAG